MRRVASSNSDAVTQAREEAEAALPLGWKLRGTDREGFQWHRKPYRILHAWAALAESDAGKQAVAVATDEAGAYRQLARRLRGELEESRGWAPRAGSAQGDELLDSLDE